MKTELKYGIWTLVFVLQALFFYWLGFVSADLSFDITMDNNTRIAIESLNESIGKVEKSPINESNYIRLLESENSAFKTKRIFTFNRENCWVSDYTGLTNGKPTIPQVICDLDKILWTPND